jgi:hypothetical protein
MEAAASGAPGRAMTATEIAITFFQDAVAKTKREARITLRELAELIRTTSAPQKGQLPWLKLANFGPLPTEKGSLRWDGNVRLVAGFEGDYDAEKLGFDQAVEILEKAGIEALVYTSPSHRSAAPRWRVLCPFSCELPPDRRHHMMGRLNGLFGGVFGAESWTLSQSYYFGAVDHNPTHQVAVIEGMPIDQCDELDKIWRGKPAGGGNGRANGDFQNGPVDEAAVLEQIRTAAVYHPAAMRLLGVWGQRGMPMLEARQRLLAAFEDVLPHDRDARWQARVAKIPKLLEYVWGKEARELPAGVALSDFYGYMPMHNYIFAPTREMWPASSVNARIPPIGVGEQAIRASLWIDQNQPVEQMTWVPGLPMIIENRLLSEGGLIEREEVRCFNLYRAPNITPGDANLAGRWVDHVNRVFPDDAQHIIKWLEMACASRPAPARKDQPCLSPRRPTGD